jgi:hypothetical protein
MKEKLIAWFVRHLPFLKPRKVVPAEMWTEILRAAKYSTPEGFEIAARLIGQKYGWSESELGRADLISIAAVRSALTAEQIIDGAAMRPPRRNQPVPLSLQEKAAQIALHAPLPDYYRRALLHEAEKWKVGEQDLIEAGLLWRE